VGISPFSYIEVSQKSSKEKLFPESVGDWFSKAIPPGKIIPFPITPEIACLAYDLGPDFHGDPADRIIAATAILHQLTLVTSDIKLLAYPRLRTLNT
jgi:PIN domain nuclease of toxin-antitoxin system